MEKLAREIA